MKRIKYYKASNVKSPFLKWLNKIKDIKVQTVLMRNIRKLCLDVGDTKRIAKGILELRIHIGPGYRVYYMEYEEEIIILLLGGDKSSQQKDIDTAKQYYGDILEKGYE
tara:strand:- start:70372 stop:70695 length:324 start_codon:yes stop_codon:yes gene_type:complete